MRKIIRRVYFPLVSCPNMVCIEHAICYEVPHLGVAILKILLHSKDRLPWLVHAALHLLELSQGLRNRRFCG